MRKTGFLLLMITLLFATGCDFLRKIAGRPTSFELEERRLEILRIEEAEQQARLDSLKRVQKMMLDSIARLDSLAVLDSIRQVGGSVLNPSSLGGLFSTKLEARYYVIVGAFRSRENAERMHKKVEGKGYATPSLNWANTGTLQIKEKIITNMYLIKFIFTINHSTESMLQMGRIFLSSIHAMLYEHLEYYLTDIHPLRSSHS